MKVLKREELRKIRFKLVCKGSPTDYYFQDMKTGEKFLLDGLQMIQFAASVDDLVPNLTLTFADTPLYIIGDPDPVADSTRVVLQKEE